MEVFVGRQPIFDIHEEVVAYELLYRQNQMNEFQAVDSDSATIQVLKNSVLTIGMQELTNGLPGFVNFTENLLMSDIVDVINPTNFVIEILEDVPITEELISRIIELRDKGFTIALDDFVLNEDIEFYNTLFTHTDIIKVDFLLTDKEEREIIEQRVKKHFPHIRLLAEKVENRKQLEEAKKANYAFYQGYFFEQPQIIKTTDIPMSTIQYFQLMNLLKDDKSNIQEIAEYIEQNVSLTYKLLHLINSLPSKKQKVRSVKQAIMMLGLIEFRKFLYLTAVKQDNIYESSSMYNELIRMSVFRGKVCELLAKRKRKKNFSEYYLIGMFSLIDTLLQRPMELIIRQLPFSDEVKNTICGIQTEMTPYLQLSIALSKVDLNVATKIIKELGLSMGDLSFIYNIALDYTEKSI